MLHLDADDLASLRGVALSSAELSEGWGMGLPESAIRPERAHFFVVSFLSAHGEAQAPTDDDGLLMAWVRTLASLDRRIGLHAAKLATYVEIADASLATLHCGLRTRIGMCSSAEYLLHGPAVEIVCSAPGFLDSGLKVITSTLLRPARRDRVAPGLDFDSRTSPASTARCTFA